MNILGISCFYHDSAACLLQDGKIIAAASEERFTRKKHDFEFPTNAIQFCLKQGGLEINDLDYVGFYDKPLLKFHRILETALSVAPRGYKMFLRAMPLWLKQKLWIRKIIREELDYEGELIFTEHHESHAASAFLPSPFDKAAILTVDGVGEWTTSAYGIGDSKKISLLKEIRFPHSLGLFYSAFTNYLGFKVNSGEYKVMGAGPYGEPKFYDLIMENLIDVKADGSFKLNLNYFAYCYDLKMINKKFCQLFGEPARQPETKLTQHYFDVAASCQKATETIVLRMANHIYQETGLDKLCLAGGVALNCVANGRIIRETPFKELFVQPAAGDAGGALGVALFIYNSLLDNDRIEPLKDVYFGPAFTKEEAKAYLDEVGATYHEIEDAVLFDKITDLMIEKNVIGWYQGRMEFGPRALGNRSIIADPRDPKMKDTVNLKIKFREGFRPFAPTVLKEEISNWFEIDRESPYMLLVAQVPEDKRVIPSVTHQDFSARIQSIDRCDNPRYYDLIKRFGEKTGVPVIINTSFNVRGEPIVCTPEDAYSCFMRTNMDYLVIENFFLDKKEQNPDKEKLNLEIEIDLD